MTLHGCSLYAFIMLIEQLLPSRLVLFFWILIYKVWAGMRLTFIFLIRLDCLFPCGSPQLSPVLQVAVIPFEIDMPRHANLDYCAFPIAYTFFGPDVVFEKFDVIFADGCCKQLAKICQRIMKVFRFADLLRIDNPADPYFALARGAPRASSRS